MLPLRSLTYTRLTLALSRACVNRIAVRDSKSSPVCGELSYRIKQWQKNPPNERMIRESPQKIVRVPQSCLLLPRPKSSDNLIQLPSLQPSAKAEGFWKY